MPEESKAMGFVVLFTPVARNNLILSIHLLNLDLFMQNNVSVLLPVLFSLAVVGPISFILFEYKHENKKIISTYIGSFALDVYLQSTESNTWNLS